jgi:hypothetical protein
MSLLSPLRLLGWFLLVLLVLLSLHWLVRGRGSIWPLFSGSVVEEARATGPKPTLFAYDPAAVPAQAEIASLPAVTVDDLLQADRRMIDVIVERKLPPPLAAKLYASVAVAQREFLLLAQRQAGAMVGDIDVVVDRVLCEFFPADCASFSVTQADATSARLADLVVQPVRERLAADALAQPAVQPSELGLWSGEKPILPQAGGWRTWVLTSGSQFRAAPPPVLGSAEDQEELADVAHKLASMTPEQLELTKAWAGGPGSPTPAGLWLQFFDRAVQDASEMDLAWVADARAALTVTMADAFIACWDTKFTYWTARPFMRISGLQSAIPTPNFPSYTSGHSTVSAAASMILSHAFPERTAEWLSLAEEARDTRLWSGIHYRVDNLEGFDMGRKVAIAVLETGMMD